MVTVVMKNATLKSIPFSEGVPFERRASVDHGVREVKLSVHKEYERTDKVVVRPGVERTITMKVRLCTSGNAHQRRIMKRACFRELRAFAISKG